MNLRLYHIKRDSTRSEECGGFTFVQQKLEIVPTKEEEILPLWPLNPSNTCKDAKAAHRRNENLEPVHMTSFYLIVHCGMLYYPTLHSNATFRSWVMQHFVVDN
jgi:hypothetical protein